MTPFMADRAQTEPNRDDPLAPEKQSLSAHMLRLIDGAKVEERRKNEGSASGDERRRRTDEPMPPLDSPAA